jgi:hypothetical protein
MAIRELPMFPHVLPSLLFPRSAILQNSIMFTYENSLKNGLDVSWLCRYKGFPALMGWTPIGVTVNA